MLYCSGRRLMQGSKGAHAMRRRDEIHGHTTEASSHLLCVPCACGVQQPLIKRREDEILWEEGQRDARRCVDWALTGRVWLRLNPKAKHPCACIRVYGPGKEAKCARVSHRTYVHTLFRACPTATKQASDCIEKRRRASQVMQGSGRDGDTSCKGSCWRTDLNGHTKPGQWLSSAKFRLTNPGHLRLIPEPCAHGVADAITGSHSRRTRCMYTLEATVSLIMAHTQTLTQC